MDDAELAKLCGETHETVTAMIASQNISRGLHLLDYEVAEEDEYDFGMSPDLQRAMASLDERDRDIVTARFVHGEMPTEIAKRLGVTRQRVDQLLRRALDQMAAQLESAWSGAV